MFVSLQCFLALFSQKIDFCNPATINNCMLHVNSYIALYCIFVNKKLHLCLDSKWAKKNRALKLVFSGVEKLLVVREKLLP